MVHLSLTEEMFVSQLLVKTELGNYVKHPVQQSAWWGPITQYIVEFNIQYSRVHGGDQ